MLIGAHVSTGGGLPKAIERAEETRCEAIQIFNQSPRMWRPTRYSDEDFAAFREAMDASPVQVVAIHMIYLINPAAKDKEMRRRSRSTPSRTPSASATGSGRSGSSSTPARSRTTPGRTPASGR